MGWQGGSAGPALAMQAWQPECDPWSRVKLHEQAPGPSSDPHHTPRSHSEDFKNDKQNPRVDQ